MKVVLDTNVVVSALWSSSGVAAQVVGLVLSGRAVLCYDQRMLSEYREVLARPKLALDPDRVRHVLDGLTRDGLAVIPPPVKVDMPDEDDRPFFEVALCCDALLITGSTKDYPRHRLLTTVREFLDSVESVRILPVNGPSTGA